MLARRSALLLPWFMTCLFSSAAPAEYSRLARLSLVEGHVSFQNAKELEWFAAGINMALQPGDRIYTGQDGRAEVEFDDGSVLRMAETTDVEILSMKVARIQLRVLVGLCSLRVPSGLTFEIHSSAGVFRTLDDGEYRFDVADDGTADAIVRKGSLEAIGENRFSERVDSGDLIHVTPVESGTHLLARYDRRDEWDEWTDRRNAERADYVSRKYLPADVYIGAHELDRYGSWVWVEGYGQAWVPHNIGPSWSPYWEGRWHYRPLWGWTWVSYEPWGWLPYHYGRWYFSAGYGWCWLPGPSFAFQFWSPGLVRFYEGPSWISWCPVGPGDYYDRNFYYFHSNHAQGLIRLLQLQRRTPGDLMNGAVAGAFRTVRMHQFLNERLGRGSRPLQFADRQSPWQSGRLVTGRLGIRPSLRSYAVLPDSAVVRPGTRGFPPARLGGSSTSVGSPGRSFSLGGRTAFGQHVGGGNTEAPAWSRRGTEGVSDPSSGRGIVIWNRQPENRSRPDGGRQGGVDQTAPMRPDDKGSRSFGSGRPRDSRNRAFVPGVSGYSPRLADPESRGFGFPRSDRGSRSADRQGRGFGGGYFRGSGAAAQPGNAPRMPAFGRPGMRERNR